MLHYNVILGITIPSRINIFIDSFKILVFQVKLANFWFLFTSVQDNVYAYFSSHNLNFLVIDAYFEGIVIEN